MGREAREGAGSEVEGSAFMKSGTKASYVNVGCVIGTEVEEEEEEEEDNVNDDCGCLSNELRSLNTFPLIFPVSLLLSLLSLLTSLTSLLSRDELDSTKRVSSCC